MLAHCTHCSGVDVYKTKRQNNCATPATRVCARYPMVDLAKGVGVKREATNGPIRLRRHTRTNHNVHCYRLLVRPCPRLLFPGLSLLETQINLKFNSIFCSIYIDLLAIIYKNLFKYIYIQTYAMCHLFLWTINLSHCSL